MDKKTFKSFQEFWPFYIGEHSQPLTRWLHFVGTSFGFVFLLAFLLSGNPLLILYGLFSGYAFAWVAHFFIEKNKPATFTHPLWSFVGDWKMWSLMLTGRMKSEVQKYAKI